MDGHGRDMAAAQLDLHGLGRDEPLGDFQSDVHALAVAGLACGQEAVLDAVPVDGREREDLRLAAVFGLAAVAHRGDGAGVVLRDGFVAGAAGEGGGGKEGGEEEGGEEVLHGGCRWMAARSVLAALDADDGVDLADSPIGGTPPIDPRRDDGQLPLDRLAERVHALFAVIAQGDGASRGREDGGVHVGDLASRTTVDFTVELDGKPFAVDAEFVPEVPVLHGAG